MQRLLYTLSLSPSMLKSGGRLTARQASGVDPSADEVPVPAYDRHQDPLTGPFSSVLCSGIDSIVNI